MTSDRQAMQPRLHPREPSRTVSSALERARSHSALRVRPENLENFCVRAMMAGGLSELHARETAQVLVITDAWGTYTHGTRQILPLLKNVATGVIHTDSAPSVVAEGPAWVLVDGQEAIGMVSSRLAMSLAIEKARQAGIAFAGVRGSGHYGAAGYYAVMAAEKEMIGLSVTNVDRRMTIPGSRAAVIGTNPVAFAAPTSEKQRPLFLDIATSVVAASKVLTAKVAGTPIPDNWIVDERGLPTSDAQAYPDRATLVPMASHKGYGIALLVEILSGVLTGASFLSSVGNWLAEEPERTDQGHAFIALNIEAFMSIDRFKQRMDAMVNEIRSAPKAEGADRIYVPGEMEWERYEEAYSAGLRLPDYVLVNLFTVADQTGLSDELEAIFE